MDEVGQPIPRALAISGATLPFPGNGDFEAPPVFVGNGPTNYDFSDGDTGWSTIGDVTFTDGVAKLTGGAQITSTARSRNSAGYRMAILDSSLGEYLATV